MTVCGHGLYPWSWNSRGFHVEPFLEFSKIDYVFGVSPFSSFQGKICAKVRPALTLHLMRQDAMES